MLRTDVDEFLDLVRQKGRISLQDASKALKIPIATIQAWVDFLVEEKIIGIEYKFTTPYVFMNVEQDERAEFKNYVQFDTKEEFYAKAQHRGLNAGQIKLLWLKYLNLNKNYMHKTFYEKAQERGINKAKIDTLWAKYLEYLESGD
jgi:hypothetical protein